MENMLHDILQWCLAVSAGNLSLFEDDLATALVTFPDAFLNCFHAQAQQQTPRQQLSLDTAVYKRVLATASLHALLIAAKSDGKHAHVQPLAALCSRVVLHLGSAEPASALLIHLRAMHHNIENTNKDSSSSNGSSHRESNTEAAVLSRAVAALDFDAAQRLILHVLRRAEERASDHDVVASAFASLPADHRDSVIDDIIASLRRQSQRGVAAAQCTVLVCHRLGRLRQLMHELLDVWGDLDFLTRGNPDVHTYLSLAQLTCVIGNIRTRGMAVAEIVTSLLFNATTEAGSDGDADADGDDGIGGRLRTKKLDFKLDPTDPVVALAVPALRRLLIADNEFQLPDFEQNRTQALIGVVYHCPHASAAFLIEQFYTTELSLGHRRLILNTLVLGAVRLSGRNPTAQDTTASLGVHDASTATAPKADEKDEREMTADEIVQQRLEKKTRRFHPSFFDKTRRQPSSQHNRFHDVAGEFFFPLIAKYDQPIRTMRMLEQDMFMLSLLLRALGTCMYCAAFAPIFPRMAMTFCEFALSLLYITDADMHQALLSALLMMVECAPAHLLLTDLRPFLTELRCWIEEVMESSPAPECRRLAASILVILHERTTQQRQERTPM
ncbi:hypothetical protein PTSG_11688 [Salpingoeca rosetta]|uniref:Telomere length regulation protein conserved domain-containing protein n=1 Tax=Salpingoeca rosetta (strain ATCC 50818 / BSB-021) TaxID=946362 RepID=F2U0X8_SALR5|nr:uncharacterized protein PTSG_11688 [Salpingoeca rosetta]EGD80552.1 hypothetical protein PTSG_11688 [Salpingoeca rosetta]|eukprot:XP_004997113.1 hypothetical protein PTSG_11688 [Salpingoeca rosetta]